MKKGRNRTNWMRSSGEQQGDRRAVSGRAVAFVCALAVLLSSISIPVAAVLADNGGKKLICGKQEHTHTADCYEDVLICGEDEREPEILTHREYSSDFSWHTHTDACRNEAGEIVCGLQEGYYHLHNEWCLDEQGNVICGLSEIAPHTHDESCYGEDGSLTCRLGDVPVLTSSEGNISTWEEVADEGHTHTDECYGKAETPSCGLKEHTHTAECYAQEEKEPEKTEEAEKTEKSEQTEEKEKAGKAEKTEQQDQDQNQETGKEEQKKTGDEAAEKAAASEENGPEKQPAGEKQNHGEPANGTDGEGTEQNEPPAVTADDEESAQEGETATEEETAEGAEEASEDDAQASDSGDGQNSESKNAEKTSAPDEEKATSEHPRPVEGVTAGDSADGLSEEKESAEKAIEEGAEEGAEAKGTEGSDVGAEGESAEEGTEEGAEEDSKESAEEKDPEEGKDGEDAEEAVEAAEIEAAEPIRYLAGELVWKGADYTVTATFGLDALFPEGTVLQVREILPEDPAYEKLAGQTENAVLDDEETTVGMMRFFDITFMTDEGEIEPQAPVNVQITFDEVIPDTVDDMIYALHFEEEGKEPALMETSTKSLDAAVQMEDAVDTVTFQSGSFSIFVVVTTSSGTGELEEGGNAPVPETGSITFVMEWYDGSAKTPVVWPQDEKLPVNLKVTREHKSAGDAATAETSFPLRFQLAGSAVTPEQIDSYVLQCVSVSENQYQYTLSGLEEEESGVPWLYSFATETVEGFSEPEFKVDGKYMDDGATLEPGSVFTIENSKLIDVSVKKVWVDGSESSKRPAKEDYYPLVRLTANGTVVTGVTPIIDEGYDLLYQRLPTRKRGVNYVYSVKEDSIKGYSADITSSTVYTTAPVTQTITITNFIPTTLSFKKTWDDESNQDGIRPKPSVYATSTCLQVLNGIVEVSDWMGSATESNNVYSVTISHLPKYDSSGTAVSYTVREKTITGYTASTTDPISDGGSLTNTHAPEQVEVKVTTKWNDENNQDGIRPNTTEYKAYLALLVNEKEEAGADPQVTDNNDGTYTVSYGSRAKYSGGTAIKYQVRENKVDGYNTTSKDKYRIVANGGTLINAYRPQTTLITVIKRWNDRLDKDGLRSGVISRIELLKTVDGTTSTADSVTVQTADLVWTKVWSGIPVYEGGKPIAYSVREVMVEANGYTTDAESPIAVQNRGKVTITDTHIPTSSNTATGGTTGTRTTNTSTESTGSSGSTSSTSRSSGGYYGGSSRSGAAAIRNVKVFYWLEKQGGEPAARTVSVNHREGETFEIYSPQIPGYQTNMTVVSGKVGVRDDVYHVIYKPMEYALTVEFLNEKGEQLASPVTVPGMRVGDEYAVPAPEVPGYRTGQSVIQGTFVGSQRIRVVYIPEGEGYTVIEDYDIPRSFGAMTVNVGECWE